MLDFFPETFCLFTFFVSVYLLCIDILLFSVKLLHIAATAYDFIIVMRMTSYINNSSICLWFIIKGTLVSKLRFEWSSTPVWHLSSTCTWNLLKVVFLAIHLGNMVYTTWKVSMASHSHVTSWFIIICPFEILKFLFLSH